MNKTPTQNNQLQHGNNPMLANGKFDARFFKLDLTKTVKKSAEMVIVNQEIEGVNRGFTNEVVDQDEFLKALCTFENMSEQVDEDNETIPAGYTYFGQFIDHDISFISEPKEKQLTHTLNLDLDSIYGQVLSNKDATQLIDILTLQIGSTTPIDKLHLPTFRNDLPRDEHKQALIGDTRNDENLIIAQMHLAFLKFHNKLATEHHMTFAQARQQLTWHYQWLVWNDFAKRLLQDTVFEQLNENKFILLNYPTVSLEGLHMLYTLFAGAAFRFGHSIIRDTYHYNKHFPDASLQQLFDFTGHHHEEEKRLAGRFNQLPSNWIINWNNFFDFGNNDATAINHSKKINPFITRNLLELSSAPPFPSPDFDDAQRIANLPLRNLKRGELLGLPTGQLLAEAFQPYAPHVQVLHPDASALNLRLSPDFQQHLASNTPLWYYLLYEAHIESEGKKLGHLGSWLVGETLRVLLLLDPNSFVHQADWQPTLFGDTPMVGTQFTFADFLQFVDELNPLEDEAVS